ncbi:hypothetical protein [Streptomyces sp. NPDC051211]|uniref:hypothetical protein n=1 Tax=Streptomyces sp. NPDC051211 TaxID=3154643 RepID=UPI00344BA407
MSPEGRTSRTFTGLLPRRAARLTGGTLATAALVLAGITTPAMAAVPGFRPPVTQASPADGHDECEPVMNGPEKKGKATADPPKKAKCLVGPPGPPGPRGPKGDGACVDIDSVRDNNDREFKAVLPGDGNAYAGIREVQNVTVGPWTWYDLTLNPQGRFPSGACAISIGHQANRLVIEVVTTGGVIWETFCNVDPGENELECDGVWDDPAVQPNPGDPPPPPPTVKH